MKSAIQAKPWIADFYMFWRAITHLGSPHFCWNNDSVIAPLARVREKQGRLLGLMDGLGFDVQSASSLEVMTDDMLSNNEIEGLLLNADNVRSSVARHLGLDIGGLSHSDHYTEGVVQVMMDAVQQADNPLTEQRLFNWHAALFPTGRSGATPITVAAWRTGEEPMLVVSGAMGKEKIHYEAPPSDDVPRQMQCFLQWFNSEPTTVHGQTWVGHHPMAFVVPANHGKCHRHCC